MTKEAIEYFKFNRKIFCEDYLKIYPKDSIVYQATLKEKEFYDMAIKALEQEPTTKNDLGVDCVSRQFMYELGATCIATRSENGKLIALGAIEDLPSVTQQEPRKGHWIDDEFGSKCSCCGIYTHLDKFDRPMKFKYCSMCGTKMESEDKTQPPKPSLWWKCERCGKRIPYMADFCHECADELLGEPPKPFEPPKAESEDNNVQTM